MPLRKPADPKPLISQVTPPAAIAGGELQIRGKGFAQEYSATAAVNAVAYHVHVAINSHALAGLLGAMFGRGAQKSNDDRMRGPL